jgi:hypothetical protein
MGPKRGQETVEKIRILSALQNVPIAGIIRTGTPWPSAERQFGYALSSKSTRESGLRRLWPGYVSRVVMMGKLGAGNKGQIQENIPV